MNTIKRTIKATLSALNAEGGMAMFSLLFWGGLALFGLIHLVVSPYSDIGMFGGFADAFPKLSIALVILGTVGVLMFGMFAYLWGICDMVSQFRNSMDISTVSEITGDKVTITNHKKVSRIKQVIKNILGGILVIVMTTGCSISEETMCLYTHDVTSIAVETNDVDYNGDKIGHRAAPMCNKCKVVRSHDNHTVNIENGDCIVTCHKTEKENK